MVEKTMGEKAKDFKSAIKRLIKELSSLRAIIVFALILLSSFTSFKEGKIPVTFILVAAIYIGQQIYQGIFVQDNISNLTHIIGGGVGAGLGFVMNKNKMNRY